MKVALTFNLRSSSWKYDLGKGSEDFFAEWDEESTIEAVRDALGQYHEVTLIEADDEAFEKLRKARPDIVFNMSEGLYGASRESHIPAMLEFLGIPYTGSDPLTLALCLDKSRAKEVLSYYGLPTAKFQLFSSPGEPLTLERFPLIVKPLYEGSSKGIWSNSVVRSEEELRKGVERILSTYQQPALVEEYLEGREFTIALLGNGEETKVLPVIEILVHSLPKEIEPIYSYEAKWILDTAENPIEIFQCPAKIDPSLKGKIEQVCLKAFRVLRCRDWCRIDLRLDASGMPHILELNPLPGVLPNPDSHSCFPKAAFTAGITYQELICEVLQIASRRVGLLSTLKEV